MDESIAVKVGKLEEKVETMEKRQDKLSGKLDWFMCTLLLTLGGVIVNLCVTLARGGK